MFETWPRWDSVRLKDLRCCPCLDWPLKIKIWLAGTRKWPAETETWQNRWRRVSCYILLFSWHKDFKATYIWDVCSSHLCPNIDCGVICRVETGTSGWAAAEEEVLLYPCSFSWNVVLIRHCSVQLVWSNLQIWSESEVFWNDYKNQRQRLDKMSQERIKMFLTCFRWKNLPIEPNTICLGRISSNKFRCSALLICNLGVSCRHSYFGILWLIFRPAYITT